MPDETPITAVARVIQLSVAPVFLLTALGTMLGVFSTRLGRIIDRARTLLERAPAAPTERRPAIDAELRLLHRRRRRVNAAIAFATAAALLVCVLIATAFVGSILGFDFSRPVAGLFIAAMVAFIGALVAFLSEVLIAVSSVRIEPR
jgi:lipopolysaccharide export LptBFGC system permease protein LptF